MRDKKTNSALVTAKRAEIKADLGNGDISSILSSITGLQNQVLAIQNDYDVLLAAHNTLLAAYNLHKHGYTDVDNLATTLNKITSTPQ